MYRLLQAEWIKVIKNFKLTSPLVWVYPIGAASVYGLGILLIGSLLENVFEPTQWTSDALSIWSAINGFPVSVFGRLLPLAFMAVFFAGEYQWGTWKNIVPRCSRRVLIISKMIILIFVVMLSLLMTSGIVTSLQWLGHRINGLAYQPEFTSNSFIDFLRVYLREVNFGLISLSIIASFAAIAAILTQSVLGSLLLSFGLSIFEIISGLLLAVLGRFLGAEKLINLYQYMPSYCIANIRSWSVEGIVYVTEFPGFTAEPSLGISWLILLVWVIGLIGISIWLFQRQDITS